MARRQHSSSHPSGLALPLALAYCGLIVYASLYPFTGWEIKSVAPWAFVTASWPRYWSGFDVIINVLGYIPLGVWLAIAWNHVRGRASHYVLIACALACLLSFSMEALQTLLIPRVPSNVDWALNTLGAWVGAMLAGLIDRLGWLRTWSRFRHHRFSTNSGAVLVLLLLWPLALLYPTPVPLGLGLGAGAMWEWASGLLPAVLGIPAKIQLTTIACLGLFIPILMSHAVTLRWSWRLFGWCVCIAIALGITSLSSGLTLGPERALNWLQQPIQWGILLAALLGILTLVLPANTCWWLALSALLIFMLLWFVTPPTPYFNEALSVWGRNHMIRFYGATQWLGYLWPYAALILVVRRLSSRWK